MFCDASDTRLAHKRHITTLSNIDVSIVDLFDNKILLVIRSYVVSSDFLRRPLKFSLSHLVIGGDTRTRALVNHVKSTSVCVNYRDFAIFQLVGETARFYIFGSPRSRTLETRILGFRHRILFWTFNLTMGYRS